MASVTIRSDFAAQENKICHCFHFFLLLFAMKWWHQMPLSWFFWKLSFKTALSFSSFPLIKRLFSSSSLPPLEWCHLYIWGCWYFSWLFWFQLLFSCQRMFKLLYNCTHFPCYQGYAQNPLSKASAKCEPKTSRCTIWVCTEEPEIKLPTSTGSKKRQENSRKTYTSASLITLKPLTVWITTNGGKFLKRWEYETTLPVSWETCMQSFPVHTKKKW